MIRDPQGVTSGGLGRPQTGLRDESRAEAGVDQIDADPDLILGRLASITVGFADGQTASLQVPVYSSEHADFAEAWNSVWA